MFYSDKLGGSVTLDFSCPGGAANNSFATQAGSSIQQLKSSTSYGPSAGSPMVGTITFADA